MSPDPAHTTQVAPPPPSRVLAGLCVVEFLSWGVLYYSLPLAALQIAAETSWPILTVSAVYTACLLCAAVLGPWAGRLVDRYGPRRVMAAGSLLGAGGMALSMSTPFLALFGLGWLIAGAAQACTLYPPAFAAATQWFGTHRTWPITAITLAGGVSSAVFAPVTAALVDALGWRPAFGVLALGYGLVSISVAVVLLTPPWTRPHRTGTDHAQFISSVVRAPTFRITRLALALPAAGLYAVTLNMIPLLQEYGFDYRDAAVVFGLVGAGQLLGRLAFLPLNRRGTPRTRTMTQAGLSALALFGVAVVSTPASLVIAAAVFAGAVRGAHTLSVAAAVSDRWGQDSYATIFGRFHFPIAISMAIAPVLGSLTATTLGSYRGAAVGFAVLALFAVAMARRT
ncbi:MFS transporter [Kocuria sp. NPDC057446]|uniref:MFS transporter n=1 Tax=Kocuria sp. NPDC057446 TaxID=3346137 RepID=UPI00369211B7